MLYMPRGTIHQAVAQEADSVHLTISTYQRWNHGELASRLMSHAAASSRCFRCLLCRATYADSCRWLKFSSYFRQQPPCMCACRL